MTPDALSAATRPSCNAGRLAYRLHALAAVNAARAELNCIAHDTDAPDWRDVDAADILDAAADLLARARP